jgi:hypothetical protein
VNVVGMRMMMTNSMVVDVEYWLKMNKVAFEREVMMDFQIENVVDDDNYSLLELMVSQVLHHQREKHYCLKVLAMRMKFVVVVKRKEFYHWMQTNEL